MRLLVKNVSTAYGTKNILHDVTLPDIPGGCVVGLLGPNASGKSTLMKCLAGEKKCDGHISFDAINLAESQQKDWFDKVATMPQSPPSPTALTPTELMWSTARALALPISDSDLAAKIEGIFKDLGLAQFSLSPLHILSGGKRQLVGLALALIRDPELLLLDEPTSALDLHWKMSVLDLVHDKVKREGIVALAALHDLDLAARYCDRLVLLNQGHIIASGTPFEVLTPQNIEQVYHVATEVSDTGKGYPRIDIIAPLKGKSAHA
jgi:iron complex transport system ATP-binding protein